MVESNPTPDQASLYVCLDCGDAAHATEYLHSCPSCGGRMRNTTVAHD